MINEVFSHFDLKISNFRKLGRCSNAACTIDRRNTFDLLLKDYACLT
jgi:hypothetical protein